MNNHQRPMSEQTRNELAIYYGHLSNNLFDERQLKHLGLLSLGYSEEEAEKACKPIDNREQLMKGAGEQQEKEFRKLARLNPRPKKPKRSKYIFKDEIVVSDVDLKWLQKSKYINSEDQKCI